MPEPSNTVELADSVSNLLYEIAGWLLVGLGVLFSVALAGRIFDGSGGVVPMLVTAGIALLFFLFGVMVNPRLRRAVGRRHGVTRFGRVSSVDQRVVRPEEESREQCVACGSRVDSGVERWYHEEFVVAGLPLTTTSEGHNRYCLDCANEEIFARDVRSDAPNEDSTDDQSKDPATERS